MSLLNTIRDALTEAINNKAESRKSILKVLMSDIQRLHGEVNDKQIVTIVKKMIENNNETMKHMEDETKKSLLMAENLVLGEFMPKMASKETIMAELIKIKDAMALQPDGVAMNIAMTHLKSLNMNVDGKLVKQCVDEVRK